ncbi:MAG TPA: NB-ARC domain-containing protein, partial [Streptosporangiaceae bacterium]|nr:NB-ARC domain-containing protein [Streptosporangiaceae bacterium]
MAAQQPGTLTHPGTLLSGIVPPLADPYYTRTETGPDLASSLQAGETVALVHGEESDAQAVAMGGTGKTQLAVEFAHAMWNSQVVEVLVWVTATNAAAVITGFAQAANMVDAGHANEAAEAAAARFVSWLAHTKRSWALIIDDLNDLADLQHLWPSGASGRILITTRLPAESFEAMDIRVIPVPGLSRREALSYLSSRLTDHPDQRIEALDLGEDLAGLPLALSQATAVINTRQQGCREYRAALGERRKHMSGVDGASATVLATWSLAAECAHELPPGGLAWPTLVLAAMMDYHGVPGAVMTSPSACSYIAGRPSTAGGADQNMVRAAIN